MVLKWNCLFDHWKDLDTIETTLFYYSDDSTSSHKCHQQVFVIATIATIKPFQCYQINHEEVTKKHLKMPLTHSIWLWWAIGVTTSLSEKKFTKPYTILNKLYHKDQNYKTKTAKQRNLSATTSSKQVIWAKKKEESLQNILGNAFNSLNLAVMSRWRHNLLEWVRVKSIASIFTEESNPQTNPPVLTQGRHEKKHRQDFGLAWVFWKRIWRQQLRHAGDATTPLAVLHAKN